MRKLVFILIAFIAAVTFIRAYEHSNEQPDIKAFTRLNQDN